MRHLFRHFTRKHLYVFLGFYAVFALLTFLAMRGESPSDRAGNWSVAATIGTLSGPFTGAIARQFQSCCLNFSLQIFPFCAAFLMGGVVAQFVPIPWPSIERAVRLAAWGIGLLGWFGGVIVSFTHALN